MELDRHEVLRSGHGTEARPVVRLADEVTRILRHGVVGVNEVEDLTVEALKDRVIPHQRDLVPPNVRDFEPLSLKAHYLPLQDPKPLHPRRLLGGLEDDLQRDTHPEERFARPERLPARLVHPALPQLPHAVSESPYTWQNHSVGRAHPLWIGREIHLRTDLLQRPRDGERIPRIVIDDRYVQASQHFSTPPPSSRRLSVFNSSRSLIRNVESDHRQRLFER